MKHGKIRQLVRCVNRLRPIALKFGKYNLTAEGDLRLILRTPKECKTPNKVMARGCLAIEQYLRNELAELEFILTNEHETRENERL